ncbi:MAG TPA: hypothetical protein VFQ54_03855, partial [Thermomicrobiales bacterium]|nr:hypothetical protein [Thermomicrobiales bacterium]
MPHSRRSSIVTMIVLLGTVLGLAAPSGARAAPAPESIHPVMTAQNAPVGTTKTYDSVEASLVSRDPKTGSLVTGVCYELLDVLTNDPLSKIGCDENSDGQVDFKGLKPTQYTVHQTQAAKGFPLTDDFSIIVIPEDAHQSFPIYQRKEQNDEQHRNVSIVFSVPGNGDRLAGKGVCVEIVGATKPGCDDNGDGQVDFVD